MYTIDASSLSHGESNDPNAVLNGIAYIPDRDAFLLTGKNWSSMHLVSFYSEEQVNGEESDSLIISILSVIWPVFLIAILIIFLSSMRLLSAVIRFLIVLIAKRQTEQPSQISDTSSQGAEEQ